MNPAPDGYSVAQWHVDSIADTGTSYATHPRQYVVTCEWCEAIFFGPTKPDAMTQFRQHERVMQSRAHRSA